MKTRIITVLAAILILLPALPGQSENLDVQALPTQVGTLPAAHGGTLELGLESAYQLALARNLNLQVGRYDLAIANTDVRGSGGIFDPFLRAWVNGDSSESPTATILEGANVFESRNTRFGLSLDALLPTGAEVGLQATSTRSENNSTFFFLNPQWNARLTATLTQPLLNGFGTVVNRASIVVAENLRNQTSVGFEVSVIETLLEVEQGYWELVATRQAVMVTEQSLSLAQRLLDETRQRVEVGTSAPIDMVQSEATVATRQQELIYARNAAGTSEDNLKGSLGFDLPQEWQLRIETTDSYNLDPVQLDLEQSIATALEKRPAILQRELEMERLDLNVKVARNRKMARLDLTGSFGLAGVSGDSVIEDPVTGEPIEIRQGWGDAGKQVVQADFPNWTVGLLYSIPLGNHQAKELLARTRYQRDRSEVELAALKQEIIRQVRFSVRAVEDGAAAIDAAVAARHLAERNLEAEQTKFDNGLSTNFQVSEIQEALATAQLSEIRARVDYRKALAAYYSSTGTYLESKSVAIVDPGAPDSVHDYWKDVEWMQFVDFNQASQQVTIPAEQAGAATE